MTKWRCEVCGFIHEGQDAPEPCPVCGATASYVAADPKPDTDQKQAGAELPEPHEGDEPAGEEPVQPESETIEEDSAAVKKWRCTVCGYIHEGAEPPDICPVCGADKSMFEPLVEPVDEKERVRTISPKPPAEDKVGVGDTPRQEEIWPALEVEDGSEPFSDVAPEPEPQPGSAPEPAPQGFYDMVLAQMLKHHIHPVSVHIPNGMLPISFIFILLTLVTGSPALNMAAFCNMIAVVACMPLVLFSGYIEWQNRYRGYLSNRFITKIVCAAVVAITALAVVVWWIIDPDVLMAVSWSRRCFLLINLIMVAAAVTAGYIGGKLVFKD